MLNKNPLRLLAPAVLAAAVVAGASKPALPAPNAFPYPTGRIVYRFTAGPVSGTSTLQWIDSGKRFRQDMKGTASQQQSFRSIESWTIGDGTHMYVHQPQMGRQIMRMKLPKGAGSPGSPVAAGKNLGKLVGKATVLGKPCEIRQNGPAKVWLWKGLALKMESQANGPAPPMSMTALKLEPGVKLSPALFKVPAGYKITDSQLPGHAAGRR